MGKRGSVKERLFEYSAKIDDHIKRDIRPNEEVTIMRFILPLFNILGWDQSSEDVVYQHSVKGVGRADIILRTENTPKVIVEAKKIGEELRDEHMKQVMRYAKKSPAKWIITTNGREIRVYNTKRRSKWGRLFFSLTYKEFDKYFGILWLLSRDKIERLNIVAEKYLEYKKEIENKIRLMKTGLIKEFLLASLNSEEPKLELINMANKDTRKEHISKIKKMSRWSYDDIKKYFDRLKQHYPKSLAYFKILSQKKGLVNKQTLTSEISKEIKDPNLKPRALAGMRAGIFARTDRAGKDRLDYETDNHRQLSINRKYEKLIEKYFNS